MGIFYLLFSKIAVVGKMVAMKKCGTVASGQKNNATINLIRSVGCALISLTVWLIAAAPRATDIGTLLAILSGVFSGILLFSWLPAATLAPMSIVETACMIGGIVPPMLLAPLMPGGDAAGILGWCGALLLFPASFFFWARFSLKKINVACIKYILLAGLSNAASIITTKLYSAYNGGGPEVFNLLSFLSCTATLGLILIVESTLLKRRQSLDNAEQKRAHTFKMSAIIYICIAMSMLYLSNYLYVLASYTLTSAQLFAFPYAIAMPLTLVADALFFKEKIKPSHLVGVILIAVSVVLIASDSFV